MFKIEKQRHFSVDIDASGVGKSKIGLAGDRPIIGKFAIGFLALAFKPAQRRGAVADQA